MVVKRKIDRIDQVGFVVTDLEAAAMHWVNNCGIGPFFVLEHVAYDKFTYYGKDTFVDLTLAFSYIGALQIELIYQHNDTPSVYTDFKKTAPNGLVHMAKYFDDLDAAAADFAPAEVIQYSLADDGVETIYMDTGFHNGGLIEFIKVQEIHKRRRHLIQSTVANWDGTRPLRLMDPKNPLGAFDV